MPYKKVLLLERRCKIINRREFFNSLAENWDINCYHNLDKINYILNLIYLRNGSKILDVGTGTGILIPLLTERAGNQGEITAIDYSNKMIEIAQRKYPYDNVTFVCEDVLKADLSKNYYDFIICYSVFPHFEDKYLAIKSISMFLKEGGKFVICHSQNREVINNIHKRTSKVVDKDNLPSIDVIKGYFKKLSFETIIEIDSDEMFVIVANKLNNSK